MASLITVNAFSDEHLAFDPFEIKSVIRFQKRRKKPLKIEKAIPIIYNYLHSIPCEEKIITKKGIHGLSLVFPDDTCIRLSFSADNSYFFVESTAEPVYDDERGHIIGYRVLCYYPISTNPLTKNKHKRNAFLRLVRGI